jgi:hypothetical protein
MDPERFGPHAVVQPSQSLVVLVDVQGGAQFGSRGRSCDDSEVVDDRPDVIEPLDLVARFCPHHVQAGVFDLGPGKREPAVELFGEPFAQGRKEVVVAMEVDLLGDKDPRR